MNLRTILVCELEAYLASKDYLNTEIIPITKQRVLSQINNPRAQPEDPALILAEEKEGNVLGFIGLLPDQIYTPEKQKVFWISCWWIHPTKGKSLGVPLLLAAHQASKGMLLADSIPETLQVFQKSKLFVVPEPKLGLKIFLKPLIKDVLLRKKPALKRFSGVLSLVDNITSILFRPITCLKLNIILFPENLVVTELTSTQKISLPENLSLFQRNEIEFDWIIKHPWILCNLKQDSRVYPFSSSASQFKSYLLHKKDLNERFSFLHLTVRDGIVKLSYAYVLNQDLRIFVKALTAFLYKIDAKEFISFHQEINKELSTFKLNFVAQHRTKYQYVWGKPLGDLLIENFQYGDGDAIFT